VADTPESTSWLPPRPAAAHVSCSVSHLLRAARRGAVAGYRCGRGWRFRTTDLDKWVEASAAPLPVPFTVQQRRQS
jgi:excisionase family DNA binding protein